MAEVSLIRYDEVPFHGTAIPAALVEKDGKQVIVVHAKSTSERIGLSWPAQYRAITGHPVWTKGIASMATPQSSGNDTLMLELRYWLLWLANIDPRRVNEESAPLLMAYQEEAADVLEAHFLRRVAGQPAFPIPQTYGDALRKLADEWERGQFLQAQVDRQQQAIEIMAPGAEFHRRVTASDDCIEVGEFAKLICVGEITFYRWLRESEIVFREGKVNVPYQEHVDAGYLRLDERIRTDRNGKDHPYRVTVITGKGQGWLQKRWDKYKAGTTEQPSFLPALQA